MFGVLYIIFRLSFLLVLMPFSSAVSLLQYFSGSFRSPKRLNFLNARAREYYRVEQQCIVMVFMHYRRISRHLIAFIVTLGVECTFGLLVIAQ